MKTQREPDAAWKLASFYFFYFAIVGGVAPYLPVYFHQRGFTDLQVGILIATLLLTKVAAPNFWGWLGDHTGERITLVRWGCWLACITFLSFLWLQGFWHHVLVLILFGCFWNAVLPQWEVITLYNLGAKRERYSRIRLWGSLGFIVAVTGLGWFFDYFSVDWLVFWLLLFLLMLAIFAATVRNQPKHERRAAFLSFLKRFREWDICLFFLLAFLLQLSFGPYYTFLSLYLQSLGYSATTIGLLWALGVAAEVLLFVWMHRVIRQFSLRLIMLLSLLLTAIRWFGIGHLADIVSLLIFWQILHAVSFGAMHATSIEFVHRAFDQHHAGQGQAMYSALSFGAGGGLGAYLSGVIVDSSNMASAFQIAGWVAILAAFILALNWKVLNPFWLQAKNQV